MSYDLMVFEPSAAPVDREAFLAWYDTQTEWAEDHGYDDPSVSSPRLAAWFADMMRIFPPLNGPMAADDPGDDATDYSIGRSVIYAAFAWSQAERAYAETRRLAEKHRVGFFDVSADDGEIWRAPE